MFVCVCNFFCRCKIASSMERKLVNLFMYTGGDGGGCCGKIFLLFEIVVFKSYHQIIFSYYALILVGKHFMCGVNKLMTDRCSFIYRERSGRTSQYYNEGEPASIIIMINKSLSK